MNLLPTLRKHAAALTAAGAGVLCCAVIGIAPACAQQPAPPASAAQAPAPTTPAPAEATGDAQRGHRKAATCLGCHAIPGYKAGFPTVYRVPMIGGQNAKYIENALKEYQKGERRFPSMMATAKSLSDQDIADVAAYFASQR
jgi:cytochrome c553